MNQAKSLSFDYKKYIALLLFILLVLVTLYPILVIGLNAFKSPQDYASHGPLSIPQGLYLDGLKSFWDRTSFTGKLLNSAEISITVAVFGVLFSLFNAYALGIGKIKGRAFLLVLFLLGNFIPQEALVYPIYYLAKLVHLYDSKLAVIFVFIVIQSSFGTYLLSSVFSGFQKEFIEAAVIDGANKLQVLFRIIFPISLPTLMVLFVFYFIWTWNEFFLPLILLVSSSKQTVPIAIATLQGQHNMDVTTSSASALLGILPCLIFFALFQRTLTRGITTGSLK